MDKKKRILNRSDVDGTLCARVGNGAELALAEHHPDLLCTSERGRAQDRKRSRIHADGADFRNDGTVAVNQHDIVRLYIRLVGLH